MELLFSKIKKTLIFLEMESSSLLFFLHFRKEFLPACKIKKALSEKVSYISEKETFHLEA